LLAITETHAIFCPDLISFGIPLSERHQFALWISTPKPTVGISLPPLARPGVDRAPGRRRTGCRGRCY
jgi:hypothetical protein